MCNFALKHFTHYDQNNKIPCVVTVFYHEKILKPNLCFSYGYTICTYVKVRNYWSSSRSVYVNLFLNKVLSFLCTVFCYFFYYYIRHCDTTMSRISRTRDGMYWDYCCVRIINNHFFTFSLNLFSQYWTVIFLMFSATVIFTTFLVLFTVLFCVSYDYCTVEMVDQNNALIKTVCHRVFKQNSTKLLTWL